MIGESRVSGPFPLLKTGGEPLLTGGEPLFHRWREAV